MSDHNQRTTTTVRVGTVLRERDTGGVLVAIHPQEGGMVCAEQFYDAKSATTRVQFIAFSDIGPDQPYQPMKTDQETTHG